MMKTATITMSDVNLIPESYQMRLMAWRDEFTRGYFEIGDIANEIVMLNIKGGMDIDNASIYSAVGRFCGKSGRTVRDYAEISAFFPEETRKYYDMLPFSHFRFAKSCGRDWERVLEYSLEHPDASEDKLAYEFTKDSVAVQYVASGVAASMSPSVAASVAPSVAASVAANDVAASVAPSVAVDLSGIYILSNLISQAETILSWNLNSETRRKLILGLESLKHVLKDLSYNEEALKFDYSKFDTE